MILIKSLSEDIVADIEFAVIEPKFFKLTFSSISSLGFIIVSPLPEEVPKLSSSITISKTFTKTSFCTISKIPKCGI